MKVKGMNVIFLADDFSRLAKIYASEVSLKVLVAWISRNQDLLVFLCREIIAKIQLYWFVLKSRSEILRVRNQQFQHDPIMLFPLEPFHLIVSLIHDNNSRLNSID